MSDLFSSPSTSRKPLRLDRGAFVTSDCYSKPAPFYAVPIEFIPTTEVPPLAPAVIDAPVPTVLHVVIRYCRTDLSHQTIHAVGAAYCIRVNEHGRPRIAGLRTSTRAANVVPQASR